MKKTIRVADFFSGCPPRYQEAQGSNAPATGACRFVSVGPLWFNPGCLSHSVLFPLFAVIFRVKSQALVLDALRLQGPAGR